VTVKSEKKLTKGNFYIAENGVVADAATTKWIDDKTVMAAKDEEDKTYYKASPVIAIKDVIADTDPVFYTAEPAEYTAEQIVIYEVAEDGSFTKISVAEAIETAEYFDTAYVAADQIIIIVEPEVTEAE
ncbi:MAG: hypothetical protein IJC14_01870, partial [Firmicutes bacterium]|nr:hypothetical protein [Bacillota bacterium]